MPGGRLMTVQDAEDLLRGLTLLGTGGGEQPEWVAITCFRTFRLAGRYRGLTHPR